MFGPRVSAAESDANAQVRFNQLRAKYQPALDLMEQQHVHLHDLHVEEGRLFIKSDSVIPRNQESDLGPDQIGGCCL